MSIEDQPKDDLLLWIWRAIELVGDVRERSDDLEPSELEATLAEAEDLLTAAVSETVHGPHAPTRQRGEQAALDTLSPHVSSSGSMSVIPFPGSVKSKVAHS